MGLILSILLGLSVANAQEGAEGEDAEIAKRLYLNGKMLFEEERYGDAVTAWNKAYEMSHKPVVLYNVAIAYEKLEEYQKSIDTLYQYRIYAPREEQDELLVKIEELKVKLAESTLESQEQAEKVYEVEKVSDVETAPAIPESQEPTEVVTTPITPDLPSPVKENTASATPMYVALGTGVASLSAGAIFGVLANQSNDMAEYAGGCGLTKLGVLLCTTGSEGEGYYWEAQQRALLADLSYGVSIVSFGTAVILAKKYSKQESNSVTSSLWISPNTVGLQGRF